MEKLIRKFVKVSYVSKRTVGHFLYICVAAFCAFMMLMTFLDGITPEGLMRTLLVFSVPLTYILTAYSSSVPTMLVMVLYAACHIVGFSVRNITGWGILLTILCFLLAHRSPAFLRIAKIASVATFLYSWFVFLAPVFMDTDMNLYGMTSLANILSNVMIAPILAMTVFGWEVAPVADDQDYQIKSVVKLIVMSAAALAVGMLFFGIINLVSSSGSETVYYDANNDGKLNAGEWWGIKDADGDEHWYREGYNDEHHIYAD